MKMTFAGTEHERQYIIEGMPEKRPTREKIRVERRESQTLERESEVRADCSRRYVRRETEEVQWEVLQSTHEYEDEGREGGRTS